MISPRFEPARREDIPAILPLFDSAKELLKANGVDQWQDGYPNTAVLEDDIKRSIAYVLRVESEIAAYAAVCFDGEPTYAAIYGGSWTDTESEYAVVHRMTVAPSFRGQGLTGVIFEGAARLCAGRGASFIRIDTHRDNLAMRRALEANGFEYRGIIFLTDGAERAAFEKRLIDGEVRGNEGYEGYEGYEGTQAFEKA